MSAALAMDAVVVLGMHNSGTSLLVHMLGLLGGYVGEPSEVDSIARQTPPR